MQKQIAEEALLNTDCGNVKALRIVLIGVGKPLHTLLDKLSNSAFYEKVNILCIFSNTDDAVLKAKADALNITVNSHDEMNSLTCRSTK